MVSFPGITQGVNAAAQSKQRFVDVGTFGETLSSVLGSARSLTTCQVDDAEGSHGVGFVDRSVAVLGGDVDLKYGVRSGRGSVRFGWRHGSVFVAADNDIHDFLDLGLLDACRAVATGYSRSAADGSRDQRRTQPGWHPHAASRVACCHPPPVSRESSRCKSPGKRA